MRCGGVGVAQPVHPDARKSETVRRRGERVRHSLGTQTLAIVTGEHQTVSGGGVVPVELLLYLTQPSALEGFHGPGIE